MSRSQFVPASRVVSVHVGPPQILDLPRGKPLLTGLLKAPVAAPVHVGRENLKGDGQGDLRHHGGPDKAVCFLPREHYPVIEQYLGFIISPGAFGENLTTTGLTEEDVCVGDQFRIGEVILEISQPREPCNSLARRWDAPQLPKLIVDHDLNGWYARVLQEGELQTGQEITLLARPLPEWSIRRLNHLLHEPSIDAAELRAAAEIPQLSEAWKRGLRSRLPAS